MLVPFRNKTVVGIVWETDIAPDMDTARILSVQTAFVEEKPLPQSWRDLLAFTSRYYHYPTGQAVFAALPQGLKETRAVEMPRPPLFYALNEAGRAQTPPPSRFNKKAALWDALLSGGMTMAALKQVNAQAAKLIEDWAEQGWIETTEASKPILRSSEFQLNADQQKASDEIQTAFGKFQPFLLYGITGSGKTEVYFDAMAKVLAQGRQVLFLLPEINLTPQLLKRVENRFADVPTAVLHSQMAAGRRTQDYLRAMLGQAKLVIGTRLAVFTPMDDVGLIVVDEEHDGSFKQDNELRYHARDLAVWRAKQSGCPVVLGSATPSLESWHKAQSGAYRLLQLTERAHTAAQLPQVEILNVGRLKLDNGFSPQALQLLKQNFEAGGMSLVYLNRRGFAPALFCGDCGHTFGCPNCSAKMVLHQRARQLRCHHCDHREPIPFKCPDCGNQDLTAVGHGTQRVEETLRAFLPKAAVVRVDRDSTAHKNDWADLYRRIADNEIDILVGTQMLAKGHDFARLNLVIVLNADGSLYSADFRAPERLFAELMQVSGRAGARQTRQGVDTDPTARTSRFRRRQSAGLRRVRRKRIERAANVRHAALRFPDRRPRRRAARCRCDGISQRRQRNPRPALARKRLPVRCRPHADGATCRTRTRANLPRIDIPTGFAPRREFVGAGVAAKPRRQNQMVGGCGCARGLIGMVQSI